MIFVRILAVAIIFASCSPPQEQRELSAEQVTRLLNLAYAKQDSGALDVADTVYRHLLKYQVSPKDSIDISNGYLSLLLRRRMTTDIRKYIDRSVPASSVSVDDRFFRSINLFQTFLIERKCDSALLELNHLYDLVEREGARQLSMTDLDQNKYALLIDCYHLPDSARAWALARGLPMLP